MVDIDLGMIVVGVAGVLGRTRMGRDLRVAGDMKVGRKFAEVDSRVLQTDLDRRMPGTQKDPVIGERRTLRNHPS